MGLLPPWRDVVPKLMASDPTPLMPLTPAGWPASPSDMSSELISMGAKDSSSALALTRPSAARLPDVATSAMCCALFLVPPEGIGAAGPPSPGCLRISSWRRRLKLPAAARPAAPTPVWTSSPGGPPACVPLIPLCATTTALEFRVAAASRVSRAGRKA